MNDSPAWRTQESLDSRFQRHIHALYQSPAPLPLVDLHCTMGGHTSQMNRCRPSKAETQTGEVGTPYITWDPPATRTIDKLPISGPPPLNVSISTLLLITLSHTQLRRRTPIASQAKLAYRNSVPNMDRDSILNQRSSQPPTRNTSHQEETETNKQRTKHLSSKNELRY